MGSSGGGGGGGNPQAMMQQADPMANIPIAGQGGGVNPQTYGQFQSFLPDIPAAGGGPAPSATGLTNEMFTYRNPQGTAAPSDIEALRTQLAQMAAQQAMAQGRGQNQQVKDPYANVDWQQRAWDNRPDGGGR